MVTLGVKDLLYLEATAAGPVATPVVAKARRGSELLNRLVRSKQHLPWPKLEGC